MVQALDGNFYGVTQSGGMFGSGTIFRVNSAGTYTKLYDFDGITGSNPYVGLIQHTSGVVFGLTVTVITPGGMLTSNKIYRVTPAIKSFTPTSGAVGTSVAITGTSLTQTTKVTFGGVAATTFTVNSDMKVTATVPTGAKTGKIAITTAGGTATSTGTFTVTQ